MTTRAGFTLIEVLIVLMIIAVVSAVLYYNLTQWIANTRLNEVGMQVMTDVRTARLKAQTTANDSAVVLCSTTSSPCSTSPSNASTTYSLSYGGNAPKSITLPYNMRISNVTLGAVVYSNSVIYSAPFSATDITGTIWGITDSRGRQEFIRITGVTGKVSISDTLN